MKCIIPRNYLGILCPILFLFISFFSTPVTACINKLEIINLTQVDVNPDDIGQSDDDDSAFIVFEVTFSIDVSNKHVERIRMSLEEGRLEEEYLNVDGKGTYEFTILAAIPQGEKVDLEIVAVKNSGEECGRQSAEVDGTNYAVLPVELVTFRGIEKTEGNLIQWTTAYEDNTTYFSVESSSDGKDWKMVKRIAAVGFSSQIQNYEVMDSGAGVRTYYRLRSVDFDGQSQVSDIIVIERADALIAVPLQAFPVPAINQPVTVNYHAETAANATIRLIDQSGRIVQQFTRGVANGLNTFTIDLSQHAQGFYLLTILANGELQKTRLIKG